MRDSNRTEDVTLAEQLGRMVQVLASTGRSILPGSPDSLLQSIVEAAAKIFGAGAASILLVNEPEGVLEFKVTWGASDHDLVGTKIPIDQGIAGYVVMTGQPIAVSNVEEDARFNINFAKSTGYVPRCILATPLIAGERILGVMEVLDKIEAVSFGMQDMELLGIFAHQAALAIDQTQSHAHLDEAIVEGLKQVALSNPDLKSDQLIKALESVPNPGIQNNLLEITDLLYEFSLLGEEERRTCIKILAAFSEYGRTQRRTIRGARH